MPRAAVAMTAFAIASAAATMAAPPVARARRSSASAIPVFAIVSCVRSKPAHRTLNDTALFKTLIPTLSATVTELERTQWTVRLYLCADDDDALYLAGREAVMREGPPWLETRLSFWPATRNRVPSSESAALAYAEGAEYMHRTNDDILYATSGWITGSVRALRALRPPNVGVAGPKVHGDGAVNRMHGGMTIDVVHRTHLRIFREYYPPQLDNWYTDSWIVYIYVATLGDHVKRVVRLGRPDNFTVVHHFERVRAAPRAYARPQPRLTTRRTRRSRATRGAFCPTRRLSALSPPPSPPPCPLVASPPLHTSPTAERSATASPPALPLPCA